MTLSHRCARKTRLNPSCSTVAAHWLFAVLFLLAGTASAAEVQLAIKTDGSTQAAAELRGIAAGFAGRVERHFPVDPDLLIEQRLRHWWLLSLPDTAEVKLHALLETSRHVEATWKNCATYILQVPDDPLFPTQWALQNTGQAESQQGDPVGMPGKDLGAVEAWDLADPSGWPRVAVLDTGIDPDHTEFHARLEPGFNFITNLPGSSDDNGHGTSVASLLGAKGNNAAGMSGLCWNVRLLPLKVFNSIGQGSAVVLANALNFARQQQVDLVNFSGGMQDSYGPVEEMISILRDQGALTIAAAGNGNQDGLEFPARYPDCVAVGAMSPCGERVNPESCDGETHWGSNQGENLFCLAPGVRLVAAEMGGGYRTDFRGTSAACALVSGGLALMIQHNPTAGVETLLAALASSSEDLDSPGRDSQTGWGLPNFAQAIELITIPRVRNLHIRPWGSRVRLDWSALDNALAYHLECRDKGESSFRLLDWSADTSWSSPRRELLHSGRQYRVKAVMPDSPGN